MNLNVKNTSVYLEGLSWLAAFWSYAINHSIWWAIFHFICGPAYVAYAVVYHTSLLPR